MATTSSPPDEKSSDNGETGRNTSEEMPARLSDEEAGGSEPTNGTSPRRRRTFVRRIWEWVPPPARYNLEDPPKFTLALNFLFSAVSASACLIRR